MQPRSIAACGQALVTKHNKLIQARYGLSLQEKRLILWLVSAIRPGDTDFHSYRVSVRALAELLGLEKNKNIYAQVAAVTRRLMRRVIEIETLDEQRFLQIHWLSSAEYHLGQGCVDLCFDPKLKPYLLQLKDQFTSIALQYAIQLKSLYAIRLYELLKQYQRLKERTLAVAELRRMLAIDAHKYTLIKDFRRRVIDIAQREINGKTDIRFAYEPIKTGRKITHFRFCIAANVPVPAPAPAAEQAGEQAQLVRRLEAFGVSPAEARRLAASYDHERIAWHLAELHRRLKSRRPIANPAAWLVQGIRDDYRPQPSLFAQAEEQRRAAARGRAERGEEIRAALATISKAYRGYLLPAIASFLAQRRAQAEDLADIEQDFQATLESHFAREQFRASGWRAPTLLNDAAAFFCQRYPVIFLSKAAYARQHNLGDPESLAAELARIESETRRHTNVAAAESMIATDAAA
jgi:hypothetical protein